MSEQSITLSKAGLKVGDWLWPWEELQAISAYVLELPDGMPPVTYLVLDHVCGEYLEVDHEHPAFENLLADLKEFVPIELRGWPDAVRTLLPGQDLKVFVRPSS